MTAFSTKADFDATGVGFGLTPTVGIGDYWLALDMNWLWTDVSALDEPVTTFVFGPRLGKTIKFKKPGSNIAFWAGAMRVKFNSETSGSLLLADLFPGDQLDELQGKRRRGFREGRRHPTAGRRMVERAVGSGAGESGQSGQVRDGQRGPGRGRSAADRTRRGPEHGRELVDPVLAR